MIHSRSVAREVIKSFGKKKNRKKKHYDSQLLDCCMSDHAFACQKFDPRNNITLKEIYKILLKFLIYQKGDCWRQIIADTSCSLCQTNAVEQRIYSSPKDQQSAKTVFFDVALAGNRFLKNRNTAIRLKKSQVSVRLV